VVGRACARIGFQDQAAQSIHFSYKWVASLRRLCAGAEYSVSRVPAAPYFEVS